MYSAVPQSNKLKVLRCSRGGKDGWVAGLGWVDMSVTQTNGQQQGCSEPDAARLNVNESVRRHMY